MRMGHTSRCGPSKSGATMQLRKAYPWCGRRHGSRIRPLVALLRVAGPARWPEVGEAVRATLGQWLNVFNLDPGTAAHPTTSEHRHTRCQLVEREPDDDRCLLPCAIPAKRGRALIAVLNPPAAACVTLLLSPPWLMPLGVSARLLTNLLGVLLRPPAADLSRQFWVGRPSGAHVLGTSSRVLGTPPTASFAVRPPGPLRISALPPFDGSADLLWVTPIPFAVVRRIAVPTA